MQTSIDQLIKKTEKKLIVEESFDGRKKIMEKWVIDGMSGKEMD